MNITRENLSDLELCIKVDIEEKDYIENVTKQLKDYQKKSVEKLLSLPRKSLTMMLLILETIMKKQIT